VDISGATACYLSLTLTEEAAHGGGGGAWRGNCTPYVTFGSSRSMENETERGRMKARVSLIVGMKYRSILRAEARYPNRAQRERERERERGREGGREREKERERERETDRQTDREKERERERKREREI